MRTKGTIWVIVVMLVGVGQIMAVTTVLDFEALAHTGDAVNYSSISEDGFTLSAIGGIQITGSTGSSVQTDLYKGSATAWTWASEATYLIKDDLGSFDLDFIDLARFSDEWTGTVVVNILGYNSVGTQVAIQSFTLPDTGDESLHTYALDNSFSGIYKAIWTQDPDFFQFDNIVLDTVPEPATLLLLGIGGLLIRKRK